VDAEIIKKFKSDGIEWEWLGFKTDGGSTLDIGMPTYFAEIDGYLALAIRYKDGFEVSVNGFKDVERKEEKFSRGIIYTLSKSNCAMDELTPIAKTMASVLKAEGYENDEDDEGEEWKKS